MKSASAIINIISCLSLCMLCTTFAAQEFDVVIERVMFRDVNSKYVQVNGSVNRINKTTKALTLFFTTVQDVSSEVTMIMQIYGNYGNEYKKLPFRWERTMCEVLANEFLWVKKQIENTEHKFPFRCPVKKGTYFIKNFVPNAKDVPANANFMWNEMIFEMNFALGNIKLGTMSVYFTLDQDALLKRAG